MVRVAPFFDSRCINSQTYLLTYLLSQVCIRTLIFCIAAIVSRRYLAQSDN